MKRRKLSTWLNEEGIRKYGVRIQPFWLTKGSYGYTSYDPNKEQERIDETVESFVDLFITFVSVLSVDATDLLFLLPAGICADFLLDNKNKFKFQSYSHGTSGIANFLNGYLAYQVIFNKKARLYLPITCTSERMFSNLMNANDDDLNQFAHFGGYIAGFLFNTILNQFKTSTGGIGVLRRNDMVLTILAITWFLAQRFIL